MRHAPKLLDDTPELRAFLTREPAVTAYMIGDLTPPYDAFCTWYGVGPLDALEGVLLVYTGLRMPIVMTYGQSRAIHRVVTAFSDRLPDMPLVQLQPHHRPIFDAIYQTSELIPMLRMALPAAGFAPASTDGPAAANAARITPVAHRDTGALIALYHHYPDSFFEPAQLDSKHYFGIWDGDDLVSVAGIHAVNHALGVAVLGNIVTHPDHRGQGLSTLCTSHLCRQLLSEGIQTVALNVSGENRSAVRVYEKLGFRYRASYLEGVLRRTADEA